MFIELLISTSMIDHSPSSFIFQENFTIVIYDFKSFLVKLTNLPCFFIKHNSVSLFIKPGNSPIVISFYSIAILIVVHFLPSDCVNSHFKTVFIILLNFTCFLVFHNLKSLAIKSLQLHVGANNHPISLFIIPVNIPILVLFDSETLLIKFFIRSNLLIFDKQEVIFWIICLP